MLIVVLLYRVNDRKSSVTEGFSAFPSHLKFIEKVSWIQLSKNVRNSAAVAKQHQIKTNQK